MAEGTVDEHADEQPLADRLREAVDPGCVDRSTKLQSVCEDIWTRLGSDPVPPEGIIQSFIAALRDRDTFLLASLRISELRPYEDPPQHPSQQRVLKEISQTSDELKALCWATGADESTIASEKRIFQQAEFYRASLLLLNSGTVPADGMLRIKEWLDAAPFTQNR